MAIIINMVINTYNFVKSIHYKHGYIYILQFHFGERNSSIDISLSLIEKWPILGENFESNRHLLDKCKIHKLIRASQGAYILEYFSILTIWFRIFKSIMHTFSQAQNLKLLRFSGFSYFVFGYIIL